MYEEHLRLAFQTGNFRWERLRITLPKKKQCAPAPCEVTLLGDATVPPEMKKVLEHGPKFCTQPRLNPIEKIALELYDEKSSKAITKNFRQVDVSLQKIKKKAVEICERLELSNLARRVKGARKLNSDVFFTAKSHKVECPFRTIVTESLSWQKEVSGFLSLHLSGLVLRDPFLVQNSQEVIEHLGGKKGYGDWRESPPGVLSVLSRPCIKSGPEAATNDVMEAGT
ncbi:hypothetical protein HPB47_019129 [Ixodes persulcatus]|uniref:Uncharacterized protein n=1 Tax=Ixodes persulcatus TaxID=34615 RepID=A0AC60QIZ6_IXOPE|nr:hypothetical protein HPB47_019129 [Ixodes persulcatus]